MLREYMVTQCADRELHTLVACSANSAANTSLKSSFSVSAITFVKNACRYLQKFLFYIILFKSKSVDFNNEIIVLLNVTACSFVFTYQLHDVPSSNIQSRGKHRCNVF
jgi:hypothetical protein